MKKNIQSEPTPMMLLNDVSRMFHDVVKNKAPEVPESYRNILVALSRKDGVSQLAISEITHLKPPTISINLRAMEADGYVKRQDDDKDRRQVNVFLTAKGKKHDNTVRTILTNTDDKAMEGFTQEEAETLINLLEKLKSNLEKELKK